MAIPKIMISSTCYDLRQVRENLESFIKNMGYESLRSEKGDIGYNIASTLQEDCFFAAQQCDILVGIIGGNFGSEASQNDSVSMAEMKRALEYKKQIYIFVDTSVLTEYRTYKRNFEAKGEKFAKEDVMYSYVNDTRIFDFINDMYNHESERVIIEGFQITSEISEFLKKQWANLFQASLSQKERDSQSGAYSKINASADKLEELLTMFDNNLQNLANGTAYLLENQGFGKYAANPLLSRLKQLLETKMTILFKTSEELTELMAIFDYEKEFSFENDENIKEYIKYIDDNSFVKIIFNNVFKDNKLVFPNISEPIENYIKLETGNTFLSIDDDDDLPF